MNYKITALLILSLLSTNGFSQTDGIVNPEDNWFFGVEIGSNTVTSIHPEDKNYFQGGLLAEYYLRQNWSINGRIKYFDTGVSNKHDAAKGQFEGAIISVPVNINWYYRFANNFTGSFKIGVAVNQEVKSNYNYPEGENTNFSKFYGSFNPGFGLNYFVSPTTAFYVNYEVYILGNDRGSDNLLNFLPNSPNNSLFNFGVKHRFFTKNN